MATGGAGGQGGDNLTGNVATTAADRGGAGCTATATGTGTSTATGGDGGTGGIALAIGGGLTTPGNPGLDT